MRTLLVDDLDSYTYNLFHLLAQVQGVEPVVVPNNVSRDDAPNLGRFDNVVISAGAGLPPTPPACASPPPAPPGARVPVPGVPPAHQAMVLFEGPGAGPAPAARHGHLAS